MSIIRTENLTKFYGKARGIVDVSLSVEEGEFFGFIGPNGAGKSTTIRTLLGLLQKTSGGAWVLEREVGRENTAILADVGYLPSEARYYTGMRAEEVIRFSARMRGRDCEVEAKQLCERLELDSAKRVEELSLGNRKKVGIVCALQHRPRLYIFDEPTSGLDPLMQKEFYEILSERNAEGATVFLSSHALSEVQRYCKRAAVIKDGRILACDRVEKLGHSGVKRVTLRGVTSELSIEGAKDFKTEDGTVQFLYGGRSEELLKALSAISFADFTVTDPDLEEIFLHYYERGEEQ